MIIRCYVAKSVNMNEMDYIYITVDQNPSRSQHGSAPWWWPWRAAAIIELYFHPLSFEEGQRWKEKRVWTDVPGVEEGRSWEGWDGKLIKLSLIYPSPRQAYTTYLLFHLSSPCILSDCFPYFSPFFTRGIRNSRKEALNISIWHRMDENLHRGCFYPGWIKWEEKK